MTMAPSPEMTSEERQLQALQLLVQLLPRDNYIVLECLLELLHRVALHEGNKMTAEALGMLFAPHLLVPKKVDVGTGIQSLICTDGSKQRAAICLRESGCRCGSQITCVEKGV